MVQHSLIARSKLLELGYNPTIINATFIKPLDLEMLNELVQKGFNIVTIEDNIVNGGFGSYVLMELNKLGFKGRFRSLGFKDEFVPHGDVTNLYKDAGLDPKGIKDCIVEIQG